MKIAKPYPYLYRDLDRQGRVRWRLRAPGRPTTTIKGTFGTPAFADAYRAALGGSESAPRLGTGTKTGSLAAVVLSYQASAAFKRLRPETRRIQCGRLNALVAKHGDKPWAPIRREHVQAMVDAKIETPSAARNLLAIMRTLGEHAIAIGWREDNPTLGVTRPRIKTPGFATWSEDHIALYRGHWQPGTMQRLALEIGLNHGPRRGDAVQHGPRQEIEGGLAYTQGKTGAEMFNTIWPPLRAAIDAMPVRGLDTYLVTGYGKPFTAAGFGNWFREACGAVPGLPKGLSFHGLRKAVCRRTAEAKGDARSSKHVMAVSGHTTLKMVERYTEGANRKRLQHEAGQAVYATFEEQVRTPILPTPVQELPTPPAMPCRQRKVK